MRYDDERARGGGSLGKVFIFFSVVLVAFVVMSVAMSFVPIHAIFQVAAVQFVVILGAAILYRKLRQAPSSFWPKFSGTGMSAGAMVLVCLTAIALGFLGNVMTLGIAEIFGLQDLVERYQDAIEQILLPESVGLQILGAVSVVIVAPFCEEILFRGTILPEQRRSQGVWAAVILNGVLFAFLHLNPLNFLALAVIGTFLAWVTVKSGSIWPAILGHGALNFVNGVVLPRLPVETADVDVELWEIGVLFAVMVTLVAGLWWGLARALRMDGGDNAVDRNEYI